MSFSDRIELLTSDSTPEKFIDKIPTFLFYKLTVESIPTISEYVSSNICIDFEEAARNHLIYHINRKERGH